MGGSIEARRSQLARLLVAVLIGGTPAWMVLLIWDFGDQRSGWSMFVRIHSLVLPLVEFILILTAMAIGFSPLRAIGNLPKPTKFAVPIWLVLAIVTSFQPGNDYLSVAIGLMKLFFAGLLLLAMVELRQRTDASLFTVIWFGIGCGVVAYVMLWMVHMTLTKPVGDEWIIQVPGVVNVRHIGYFAFAGFCAGIVCLISFRDHVRIFWRWCIPILFSAVGLGLALWTGSRGPTLAAILATIAILMLGTGFRRQLGTFFISSAIIAAVTVVSLPVPHPTYGIYRAIGAVDFEADARGDASSGRTALWRQTINQIQQRPVFGWGLEQFATRGPKTSLGMRHPHNYLLQMLFSGGMTSILLLIFAVLPTLRRWRWPDKSGIGLAGVGCVVGLIAYSMYDGALFFSYPIMLLCLAIGTSIKPQIPRHATCRSDLLDQTKADMVTR